MLKLVENFIDEIIKITENYLLDDRNSLRFTLSEKRRERRSESVLSQ